MLTKVYQPHGFYMADENGQFHSENDEPAIVINSYEDIEMVNDEEVITSVEGYRAWYNHGKLHRIGNPAVIRDNGSTYYYINGEIQR
jgi:hypothetical protein